jgi:hypothetical protein
MSRRSRSCEHRGVVAAPHRRRGPLRVKMILPALLEATAPGYRPIKYALFPPLGLAGLAGYLDPDAEVELVDEHVDTLDWDDAPDLVVMTVYITSAKRPIGSLTTTELGAPMFAWAACIRARGPRKPLSMQTPSS